MSRSVPVPPGRMLLVGAFLVAAFVLTGCMSSQETAIRAEGSAPSLTPTEAEQRVRDAAQRWDGAPYKFGGTSKRGVDCSALVQSVYSEEFGLSLPRSTKNQAQVGERISRSSLQPGDLVFFHTGWKQDHVGIYLTDGQFLHVSSNVGVTISRLDGSYWQENWWQARRLLSSSGPSKNVAADTIRTRPSSGVGW